MEYFDFNPEMKGLVRVEPDVVFSHVLPEGLRLCILKPYNEMPRNPYPCVVFVQGSAWTFPVIEHKLANLGELSARGMVVAMVTHRNALEGHPFPACLQDVKTAIRFLRAEAERFHIDPQRLGIWGTSSGGHMALMTGMTPGEPAYETEEYAGESDAVNFVVDCFGPTDLETLFDAAALERSRELYAHLMAGHADEQAYLRSMSPLRIAAQKSYPPFLILHGDADKMVDYSQSTRLVERLEALEQDVEFVCVRHAGHENDFWSEAVFQRIYDYIEAHV